MLGGQRVDFFHTLTCPKGLKYCLIKMKRDTE